MNKQIKKHLQKRGVQFMEAPRTDGLFGTDRSASCFFNWFFEEIMRFDSLVYRRQFWLAASTKGYTIGPMPRTVWEFTDPRIHRYNQWLANLLFMMILMGVSAVVWCLVKETSRHLRRLRRPTYYEQERAKRLAWAEERRKITKRTTNHACPTVQQLTDAFRAARQSSANMIRLGSLLEDLECYVNNKPYWSPETRQIVGRHGGIRQWLRENAPELSERYKTLMRYKALSKKFRQAVGIADPISASDVLPQDADITSKGLEVLPQDDIAPAEKNENIERTNSHKQAEGLGYGGLEVNENTGRTNSHERAEGMGHDGVEGNENIGRTGERENSNGTENSEGTGYSKGRDDSQGVGDSRGMMDLRVEGDENRKRCADVVREILGTCEGTVVSLDAQIALYVGVACIAQEKKIARKNKREQDFQCRNTRKCVPC